MEILLLKEDLEKSYVEFNDLLSKHIKSFEECISFTFSFSKEQSMESFNNYCKFSVCIADFYQHTSAICAKLAGKLISAYDSNDPKTVDYIDQILKKQILVEKNIGIFVKSCEIEIDRSNENISPKFLYNQALELKQKLEILISK